ncbi:hypothetical protein MMC11_006430 [Xylographa trunciseda]|nr:hypothetical protein [Xylographa trunciseda]
MPKGRIASSIHQTSSVPFLVALLWRIIKRDVKSGTTPGDNIKDGKAIRLCWHFSDQTSGFRDYRDDVFGRRQFARLDNVPKNDLYLKVPHPRFENPDADIGIGLVLSTEDALDPVIDNLALIDKSKQDKEVHVNYFMFDLTFRMDSIGNNRNGEVFDYMISIAEEQIKTFEKRLLDTQRWSEKQSVGDLFNRGADNFKNVLSKGVDSLANSFLDGSAMSVAAKMCSTAVMYKPLIIINPTRFTNSGRLNPIGALCSFLW